MSEQRTSNERSLSDPVVTDERLQEAIEAFDVAIEASAMPDGFVDCDLVALCAMRELQARRRKERER